jgi:hypothetical protein
MNWTVRADNKPFFFEFEIDTKGNNIGVVVYDVEKPKNEYYNRILSESGKYKFTFPKPPKNTKVQIGVLGKGDVPKSDEFSIYNFKCEFYDRPPVNFNSKTNEFIHFAEWFAENLPYLKPGNYYSGNKTFQISLYDVIEDDRDTPSRIHKYTGVIDVSKKWFVNMAVPDRIATLLHEFAHNHMNHNRYGSSNEIEKEADENALKLYMALGYPKSHWIYTWTRMFEENNMHYSRLDNSINKLQLYHND